MIEHRPVMLEESVSLLAPERGGVFVDCTVGLGGHAAELLQRSHEARVIGIDRDIDALVRAKAHLGRFGDRAQLVHGNHDQLADALRALGVERVSGVLADLGVSSLQLERADRGFSFQRDGPLDMRMDKSSGSTAADIVRKGSEEELERILIEYGEERQSRRIARALVREREHRSIETTAQLREVVHQALGRARMGSRRHRAGGIDSATRTFQALRVEVNQELSGLERMVNQSIEMLDTDGRLVVISYHSLEDRLVKTALRDAATGQVDAVTGKTRARTRLVELLTKKPLRPSEEEVAANPRSRSARLRAARRL